MTWASYFVKFGSALFVLPLILINFSEAEIAVWFLFMLILSMALIADSGFGPTITRATSYYYSGMKNIPKNIDEFKNSIDEKSEINFIGLSNLLNTFNIAYIFLGLLSVLILLIVGEFIVSNAINMTANIEMLTYAFYIIVFRSFLAIQFVKWSSFIQGIDKVADIKKAESVSELFKIVSMFLLLTLGYGIFELMIIECIFTVLILIYAKWYIKNWYIKNNQEYSLKFKFNKDLFNSIWPATWRFGAMQYGGFMTNNGTSIIVSQLNSPTIIASFLLTQKLIFFIRQIAQAPLYSNLPRIFQMMAIKDYDNLKPYCAKGIIIGLIMQFIALSILLIFGSNILELFNINASLAPLSIILIMSISIMLELHHAYHAQIYMGSNHVPFLLPGILSGIAIVGLGFSVVDTYGLIGIVLVQFFVQLSLNNWYPVYLNLKLLDWKFIDYLRCLINFRKCR
jgi:hypothetical protein